MKRRAQRCLQTEIAFKGGIPIGARRNPLEFDISWSFKRLVKIRRDPRFNADPQAAQFGSSLTVRASVRDREVRLIDEPQVLINLAGGYLAVEFHMDAGKSVFLAVANPRHFVNSISREG